MADEAIEGAGQAARECQVEERGRERMKVHKITTHLSPAEALTMIELCDALREQLAKGYGEEIRELMFEANREKEDDLQRWRELEDPF